MISRRLDSTILAAVALPLLLAGCRSPFASDDHSQDFRALIDRAVDHELAAVPRDQGVLTTTQPPAGVEETLAERREELDRITPASTTNHIPFNLGVDLTGSDQRSVELTLESVVHTAVASNLAVESARFQPAINREDVVNAQAVFDFVLFGNVDLTKTDEPAATPILGVTPLGTPFSADERYRFETGVRKQLSTGGSLQLSTDLTRFRSNTPGFAFSPDPAYTAAIRAEITQPLLRGFGDDVNRAEIRLAENAQDRSIQELRAELLHIIQRSESAYWDLVYAWKDLEIAQWLVDVGEDVRDKLDARRDFDATPAQFADAVARVERRKADVILARRAVHTASDALKQLMNDPELTVGNEVLLRPIDDFIVTPINYNLRDGLTTALANRPEIEQSLLAIRDTEIIRTVANNARLPLLDITGGIAYFGLDDDFGNAYQDSLDDDFINYVIGLRFEQPIGNRGPEAVYRRSRLQRAQALTRYRQAVQTVVLDYKTAIRDVVTAYSLIRANKSTRIAEAENLRALVVEEENLAGLTPEFLNLKFQRQERLAQARQLELAALRGFDQSVARVYETMGTGLQMNRIGLEIVQYDEYFVPDADNR